MSLGTDFESLGAAVAERVGAGDECCDVAKAAAGRVVSKTRLVTAADHQRFLNTKAMAIATSLGGQWEKQDRSGVVEKYSHLADTGFMPPRLGIKPGAGVVLVGYTFKVKPFRFYVLDDDPMHPDQMALLERCTYKSSCHVLRAQTPKVSGVVDTPWTLSSFDCTAWRP